MTDAEAREFLDEMSKVPLFRPGEWAQIGIAEPEGLALVGDIGLYLADDLRRAEIGFTLARPAQGRGLATTAVRAAVQLVFRFTPVDQVLGIADARNHASVRLLERAGMRKQEDRNSVFRGESCVESVYAVSRSAG